MNQLKFVFAVTLFFLVSCVNTQSSKVVEPVSREKAFIRTMQELIKTPGIKDYVDRSSLSKGNKLKLIVSDIIDNPIFTGIYENEDFIIAPNSEILKSKAKIYLMPTDVSISKDSCSIKFEIVNKFNHALKGNYTFIPDKPSKNYDVTTFTTKGDIRDIK